MTKRSFYIAVGSNGGIVTDGCERAQLCRQYLRGEQEGG